MAVFINLWLKKERQAYEFRLHDVMKEEQL